MRDEALHEGRLARASHADTHNGDGRVGAGGRGGRGSRALGSLSGGHGGGGVSNQTRSAVDVLTVPLLSSEGWLLL